MSKPSRWRFLVEMPTPYNPSSRPEGMRESQWGRTWTLERDDGKRAVVEIEASQVALDAYVARTLPKTARRAIQTEGRSAFEGQLGDAKLPGMIHITGAGIRRHR